jgi:Predicted O-methyltransferase
MAEKTPLFYRKFDYDRRLVPNAYVASRDQAATNVAQAEAATGLTVGYPGWNILYYVTLASLKPGDHNVILETGTNWGFSTIMLAQALRDSGLDGEVHSSELDPENHRRAQDNLAGSGVGDLVRLHLGDSLAFLREFAAARPRVRVAFLDSGHDQEHVLEEFRLLRPLLDEAGTVIFDNTFKLRTDDDPEQNVNGGLRRIMSEFGGNLVNFPHCSWYTPGMVRLAGGSLRPGLGLRRWRARPNCSPSSRPGAAPRESRARTWPTSAGSRCWPGASARPWPAAT